MGAWFRGGWLWDEYFSRTDAAGTRSFLTEGLGSTVAMADASGTVQTSYTYEPFGRASTSGAADANPLQFTGRENDGTGLQYNRARYYSPTLQRFISQDPLGFGGGDVNTHAYAGDSPTNATDPSGEFAFLIPMAVGGLSMAAFSVGWNLVDAKLTGRKLDVGDMLVTEDSVRRYWQTRRELLDSNWNAFTGPFGQIMSSMDTAVDSYSADADRGAHQIDERRLREESEAVMTQLRRSGLDLFQ
jgi:RHS repeat-associated protein